jgi:hypothetical protein
MAINNTNTVIGTVGNIHLGALQLAPDQKIYVTKHDFLDGDPYLGVINSPNTQGMGCDFVEDGVIDLSDLQRFCSDWLWQADWYE